MSSVNTENIKSFAGWSSKAYNSPSHTLWQLVGGRELPSLNSTQYPPPLWVLRRGSQLRTFNLPLNQGASQSFATPLARKPHRWHQT